MPLNKRIFDVLAASLGTLILSPLLLLIALSIRVADGYPIFFKQVRAGKGGKPFLLWKFRTMRDARDDEIPGPTDGARMTRLGKWLRAVSLDELPELYNILRGEMSFVGPRPLLMQYLPLYSPDQARRHDIVPGLTGWAQINGRNELDWPTRLAMDIWYVDHRSFWMDMRILIVTAWKAIRREGVSQSGEATTKYFTGNPS